MTRSWPRARSAMCTSSMARWSTWPRSRASTRARRRMTRRRSADRALRSPWPLLLVLAVLPLTARADDLLDAYRQAVANDPVLSSASAAQRVTAENVPQARSALLPQLSLGLGLEQIHGGSGSVTSSNGNIVSTGGGRTRERDLSGTLSQPLLDVAAIARLRAAHASRDAGEQVYRAAAQRLCVRVAAAYFNVLVAEDELDVFRSYEDAYKQEFRS